MRFRCVHHLTLVRLDALDMELESRDPVWRQAKFWIVHLSILILESYSTGKMFYTTALRCDIDMPSFFAATKVRIDTCLNGLNQEN